MVTEESFLFVGYLVQEPYLEIPAYAGIKWASISRDIVPSLDKFEYDKFAGLCNVTKFLTYIPAMSRYEDYVLNGYAIELESVLPEIGLDGSTLPSRYEYAKHWDRPNDGMVVLGYDVVDEPCHPRSYIFSGDYELDEISKNAGPLNEHGLLSNLEEAELFRKYILEDDQSVGTIWQVWG